MDGCMDGSLNHCYDDLKQNRFFHNVIGAGCEIAHSKISRPIKVRILKIKEFIQSKSLSPL